MSRYIPVKIDRAIKERDFFECVWCGTMLTDRHHIIEYAEDGEHSVENLVLLCPNCHRQVHNGEISVEDLNDRIRSHKQGDRMSGSIYLQTPDKKVKVGGATFIDTPIIMRYGDENLIEIQKLKNGKYSVKARFYDELGRLIFWMSDNRYFASVPFTVESDGSSLFIKNKRTPQELSISIEGDFIVMKGLNFIGSNTIHFTDEYVKIGSITLAGGGVGCQVGFQF